MKRKKGLSGSFFAYVFAIIILPTSIYAIPPHPCDDMSDLCCEEPPPGPFGFSYPFDRTLSCPRDFFVY